MMIDPRQYFDLSTYRPDNYVYRRERRRRIWNWLAFVLQWAIWATLVVWIARIILISP